MPVWLIFNFQRANEPDQSKQTQFNFEVHRIEIEIRGFTFKYSKNKSGERNSTETILLNRINDLYKRP